MRQFMKETMIWILPEDFLCKKKFSHKNILAYFEKKKNSIHNQEALVIHYEKTQGFFFLYTFPKKT